MIIIGGITVNVNVTDTDKFQEILNVVKEFISDERIPAEAQQEFKDKMLLITKKSKS